MNRKLKTYELTIDGDETKVSAVALVGSPAIEKNFIAFSAGKSPIKYVFSEDEKRELLGAAMIPDQPIYRFNEKTGDEYNVVFSANTIRTIAQNYFKQGFQSNTNLEHQSNVPAHSYIFQSYIVDSTKGVNAPKGMDLPDGSWIVGMKVEDSEVWNKIKSGEVQGFSIEGIFEHAEVELSREENVKQDVVDLFNDILTIIK